MLYRRPINNDKLTYIDIYKPQYIYKRMGSNVYSMDVIPEEAKVCVPVTAVQIWKVSMFEGKILEESNKRTENLKICVEWS